MVAEKQQALDEVSRLTDLLDLDSLGLERDQTEELRTLLGLYQIYVEGFFHCARACFSTRLAQQSTDAKNREGAASAIEGLRGYKERLISRLKDTRYPHYVYWFLDTARLAQLLHDLDKCLKT